MLVFFFTLLGVIEAQRVFKYKHYLAATAETGCVNIDTSSTAVTLDMSGTSCGNSDQKCPGCYVISASGNQLTINNCHYIPFVTSTSTDYVRLLSFANMGNTDQSIHDGTQVVRILKAYGTTAGGSMTQCMCVAGKLSCS